jgi:hypothetical protein
MTRPVFPQGSALRAPAMTEALACGSPRGGLALASRADVCYAV